MSFDVYDLSVRQVVDMVEEGNVFVPPEYQRQFIWGENRQSALIESILLGIPVPSVYMATNADSTWEVVDGVQRIGSLCHFIGTPALLAKIERPAPLTLMGLEKLSSLDGLTYQDLPKSLQLHFSTRPLRVTVLNDKSDLSVRFDLFERLNTGGVALTDQEIRNCVFRGKFNDTIKSLSKHHSFLECVKLGDKPEGGAYEELVLRFFAYLDRYQEFDHLVKQFLNDYMRESRNSEIPPKKIKLFKDTFDLLHASLPSGIVRNRSKTPVNLFEAVSVGVALALQKGDVPKAPKIVGLLNDPVLKGFTGAGSNQKKMVRGRIELVRDLVA